MRILVGRLKIGLDSYLQPQTAYSDDALGHTVLWLLFIGGLCSVGHPERPWFAAHVGRVGGMLGLKRWQDVRNRQIQCFYVEDPLGHPLESVWRQSQALHE